MSGLRVKNLSVALGGAQILTKVSFTVEPGQVVGLIGPNGAGKSTALKAALGIIESQVGEIWLDGSSVFHLPPKERAKRFSYVPQGAPVHWPLTTERLVGLGRIPHLTPWQTLGMEDQQAIQQAMERSDCLHLKDRLVTTLSGGERSRVLLARALAVGAPYLLADEPTASLDPQHQLQVMNIMQEAAARGTGVLIVMHDLSFAQRYCDKIVLLDLGRVVATGTSDEVLTDKNLEAAFKVKVVRWSENGVKFLAPHQVNGR